MLNFKHVIWTPTVPSDQHLIRDTKLFNSLNLTVQKVEIMYLGLTWYHKTWTNVAPHLVNLFTTSLLYTAHGNRLPWDLYPAVCLQSGRFHLLSSQNGPAKKLVLFYKSVGIMGRGEERGSVNRIKPCQVLQLSKHKICAIFRRFLFLVNRKAVSLYFSEHK